MALILVVENEQLLRWTLIRRLEQAGHEVLAAADLAQAALHIEHARPEVVLLDECLPDGSGLDFLERHRAQLAGSAVLLTSAVGGSEESARAERLGARAFLNKPIEHKTLLEEVDRCLLEG